MLESSKPWLYDFAHKIASGEAHIPGPMLLFFRMAADPIPKLLFANSFQDWAVALDRSEKEFTVQTMHSEAEFSEKSTRTLERYLVQLQKSGAVLSRTKGYWGERGTRPRPDDYGRTPYHYRLNPLSRIAPNTVEKSPDTIREKMEGIDRDFLSFAEKFLVCLPGYRELLARALSVVLELASNPNFLALLWQIPEFSALFDGIDVGMIDYFGKQLSLLIPEELVPRFLVRRRIPVSGDYLPWEEARRLRLQIDLG